MTRAEELGERAWNAARAADRAQALARLAANAEALAEALRKIAKLDAYQSGMPRPASEDELIAREALARYWGEK